MEKEQKQWEEEDNNKMPKTRIIRNEIDKKTRLNLEFS